jgi:hypothetical protein
VRVWTRKHVLITHPGGTQARADHDPCANRPGQQHILLILLLFLQKQNLVYE